MGAPSPLVDVSVVPGGFAPTMSPILLLGSTEIKFARTLETGLELSLTALPAGERPLEGGEVDLAFLSNRARSEATPALGECPDMTTVNTGY